MKTITPGELKQKLDNGADIFILDIRDQDKYAAGHIPGSHCIPQKDVPDRTGEIPKKGMVVICCAYGLKSDQVYLYLSEKKKYRNLRLLEGGVFEYALEVNPTIVVL